MFKITIQFLGVLVNNVMRFFFLSLTNRITMSYSTLSKLHVAWQNKQTNERKKMFCWRRDAIYCSNFILTTRFFWPVTANFLNLSWSFCEKAVMKIFIVVILVNLAENTCDRNTIMINVPIILCRCHFLLSELHRRGTHKNLVVHIRDVWP